MYDIGFNLEHVIEFRNHLVNFNRELGESFKYMRGHAAAIRDDWNDPQYERFIEAFEEVAQGIEKYLTISGEHEDYLIRLIERARDLLDTRL